jgi:hypothetical protein
MLANPYGVSTPTLPQVKKPNPRTAPDNDNATATVKPSDRAPGRPPEPHWDAVISAATD